MHWLPLCLHMHAPTPRLPASAAFQPCRACLPGVPACLQRGVRKYMGQWEGDLQEGEGKCIYADGSQYDGQWKAGLRCAAAGVFWERSASASAYSERVLLPCLTCMAAGRRAPSCQPLLSAALRCVGLQARSRQVCFPPLSLRGRLAGGPAARRRRLPDRSRGQVCG